jgi:D-lactate dehydrogenase (cytochrome)
MDKYMASSLENFVSDLKAHEISVVRTDLTDFLKDESRFRGHAEGLIRPSGKHEVVQVLAAANRSAVPVTIASGRTSLTGASVPAGGIVMDLSRLNALNPADPSETEPGINLKQYKSFVELNGLFYPPDPTSEESCTLGGTVATNASGALSYKYGPTRDYVEGIEVVLASGLILKLNRGQIESRNGEFRIPADMFSPRADSDTVLPVPGTEPRPWRDCKNSAGLFSSDPLDLMDLFIGSEGILGVIVKIKTRLLPARPPYFALMAYLPDRQTTVRLVTMLDNFRKHLSGEKEIQRELHRELAYLGLSEDSRFITKLQPSCMEWLHRSVAPFLSAETRHKLRNAYGALYIEQEYGASENPMERASIWAELVAVLNEKLTGREIVTEVAFDSGQIRRMRKERQSVPEQLNEQIRPGLVKVATDFSVPMKSLDTFLALHDELPPGKTYWFGHIGNAHIHANMIPDSSEEMELFRAEYRLMAKEICSLGGSVSGEHGIGKLKHDMLEMMIGRRGLENIRSIKRILDPRFILNPGNVVPETTKP